jgi:hypothetical protein
MKKLFILMLGTVLFTSCCASDPSNYKKYEVKLPDGSVEYVRAAHWHAYENGVVEFGPGKIATYKNFVSIREVEKRPHERY